jgi:ABC-2 type transport system ATP-binding protein
VANGTPDELKKRSDIAGSVLLQVKGLAAPALLQKVETLPSVRQAAVLGEARGVVSARVFPQPRCGDGELARSLFEALAKESHCQIEELHTEEGRLDEVFRSITKPDTAKEGR